jgi:hypothetical protein
VLGKIVQNGLPPLALLFLGVRRLRIERDAHRDTLGSRHKLDDTRTVSEGILNQLVRHNLRIRSSEIKAKASILGV